MITTPAHHYGVVFCDGMWFNGVMETTPTHNDDTLSGDCEIDCQERCAYPGQFTECEPGLAYYDTRDEVLRPEWMERDPDHFDDSANWPESWQ